MRKIEITSLLRIIIVGVAIIIIPSCKKEPGPDTKDLLAYVSPGDKEYNLSGWNITLLRTSVLSSQSMGFPVQLSRPFTNDVKVSAKIDTNFLAGYDSAYKTTHISLPNGAFALDNDKVTIKVGQAVSADSIHLILKDPSGIKGGTNTYVVPVVITMASAGVQTSTTRKVMYMAISITSVAVGISDFANNNVVDISLERDGNITTGQNMIYLQTLINKSLSQATTSNVAIAGADLLDSFNKANSSNYKPFPTGAYKLVKASASIPANAMTSTDSIQIALPDLSLFESGTDYLMAVKIIDDSSPGLPLVDANKNIVFVHVSIFINNVDPLNAGLVGASIDRTNWSVTSGGSDYLPISNILDGDNNTAWDGSGILPEWIVLDMGSVGTVKGFSIIPSYVYTTDDFINMDVLSSSDNVIWKLEGKYVGTSTSDLSTPDNPDTKTVKFYTPVTARYFKFNITKTSPGSFDYAGMGELYGIQ